jgi:hypothetical protein
MLDILRQVTAFTSAKAYLLNFLVSDIAREVALYGTAHRGLSEPQHGRFARAAPTICGG